MGDHSSVFLWAMKASAASEAFASSWSMGKSKVAHCSEAKFQKVSWDIDKRTSKGSNMYKIKSGEKVLVLKG